MGIPALILMLGSLFLPRWRRLRPLDPERRLLVSAGLALLALVLLRLAGSSLNDPILAGQTRPFHIDLATLVAGLASAVALGLCWIAILDDARTGAPRTTVFFLVLLPLLLSSCAGWWVPRGVFPSAAPTGGPRPAADQPSPRSIIGSLVAFAAVLAWPAVRVAGPCWAAEAAPGTALLPFARAFLGVQFGLLAARFLLGIIFGPRRIGRRLLVSHMLAGLVPVALLVLFSALIAMLALANVRARVAAQLLRMQHDVSQEMLAQCVRESMADRERMETLLLSLPEQAQADIAALHVAGTWPAAASWQPMSPPPTLFVSLGVAWEEESWAVLAEVVPGAREPDAGAGEAAVPHTTLGPAVLGPDPEVLGWVLTVNAIEESRTLRGGETARLDSLPAPSAWLERPEDPGSCGLVAVREATFHASDHRVRSGNAQIRVQVIEPLSGGQTRILSDFLGLRARIEERFRFTSDLRMISPDTSGTGRPAVDDPSSYSSAHVLLPALEWGSRGRPPSGDSLRVAAAGFGWEEIRVPVLGISSLYDLIPPLPGRENLLGYVPIIILISTAILFVVVESFAFFSALRMGRAIATSVSKLREGTEQLQRGEFSHRIALSGHDELSALGEAFNEMAAGLEEAQRTALEKERLEGELALARRIQQRLLPGEPPSIPGLQLAGVSVPARQVGGDYYDFLPLGDGQLLFIMADVSGKGAPAALLMSSIRAALHSMLPGCTDLAEIAGRLNRFIHGSTGMTEFATAFLGLLDASTGRLCYVNAGHEHPYLLRDDGNFDRLREGGLMLGAFPETSYEEATVHLKDGDLLFLFTDGLTEAHDPAEEMFGEERCMDGLRVSAGADPAGMLSSQLANVKTFVRGAEPSDDITLIAIRRVSPL